MQHTPLFDEHQKLNAKIISFADYALPLQYTSQLQEALAVRQHAGIFDVSHMLITDIEGKDSMQFVRYFFARDVATLHNNQAAYGCILNQDGFILDDAIIYKFSDTCWRLISNGATRSSIQPHLQQYAQQYNCNLKSRDDLAIIALQGPAATEILSAALPEYKDEIASLKRFYCIKHPNLQIARTGYTGENGYELIADAKQSHKLWRKFIELTATPCGLGARDILRLEAGYNLYGQDMSAQHHPFDSNLGWTVSLNERDFIGKQAVLQHQEDCAHKLTGIMLNDKGVLRNNYSIETEHGPGIITSGIYSPTLQASIALARIPKLAQNNCTVIIRDKKLSARIINPANFLKK